jgi:hypothetical protein
MRGTEMNFESGPPLMGVLPFFLTAPLFVVLAGATLLVCRDIAFVSSWQPLMVGLTHVGTLGVLMMVMLGAFYQVAPVVVGAEIPYPRLAHGVHGLLTLASLGFFISGVFNDGDVLAWSARAAALAVLLFLVPAVIGLLATNATNDTVWGLRLALLSLVIVGSMGLLMSQGYAGVGFPGERGLWIQLHLSVAFFGWVGGLLTTVSWQVVPMFYLSHPLPMGARWGVLSSIALSVILLVCLAFAGVMGVSIDRSIALLVTLPGAIAVGVVHPVVLWRSFATRRRKRPDASLEFWKLGISTGPLVVLCAALAHFRTEPHWGLAFGWLALWGWAGCLLHGMLHRIVPFLVWMRWLSEFVGRGSIPTTRKLLPDSRTRICLWTHAIATALGLGAILSGQVWLLTATAVGLILCGFLMLWCFLSAVVTGLRVRKQLAAGGAAVQSKNDS